MAQPTYIFEDGKVYTEQDGAIVASVKEADFDEAQGAHPIQGEVQMPEAPAELQPVPCPGCGQPSGPDDKFCPECGTPLDEAPPEYKGDFDSLKAEGVNPTGEKMVGLQPYHTGKQVVTTPNGLKGRVLARVPGVWGEEVTVRFENGVIKKIPVDTRLTFANAEESASESPFKALEERLAATSLSDKDSLIERANELKSIKREARKLIADATDSDAAALDQMSVEAGYELKEVEAALDHLADIEGRGFEPPAPVEGLEPVVQSSTGSSKADWLESVHEQMISEAAAEDFTKLMDEGPEAFVASLDTEQIADAGTTRVMATREIRSHTAGANEETKEDYERVWLARVEEKRREELASRKEVVRKEAASDEEDAPPDESLFI